MKQHRNIILILIIIGVSIFLFVYNYQDVRRLNKNGVYVIGELDHASSEGQMSWIYYYRYYYKGKVYTRNFTGPVSKEIIEDSLMFFKILPKDPTVCRQLSNIRVPTCLSVSDVPIQGWTILPNKVFCDSVEKSSHK